MTNNPLNQVSQGESQTDENTKLQKRIRELRKYQSCEAKRQDQSASDFIGYAIAGLVLWFVMHKAFEMACWPESKLDADPNYLGTKGLWNVVMYVVPFCFWGIAIKHLVIGVFSWIEYYFAQFKITRLKKKLVK